MISKRAERILKSNTSITTVWNKIKPEKEFWNADETISNLRIEEYFGPDSSFEDWPEPLKMMKGRVLVMSAFGALVWYLRSVIFPSFKIF